MVWDLRSLCDKADYAIIRYAINRIPLYSFILCPVQERKFTKVILSMEKKDILSMEN